MFRDTGKTNETLMTQVRIKFLLIVPGVCVYTFMNIKYVVLEAIKYIHDLKTGLQVHDC